LIETFHYEWIEENLTSSLKIKLEKQGIICKPIKSEDVLKKLREEGRIADWSDLLKKALQAIRVERLTEELIANRLERAGISQPKNAATLLDALHQGYIQELKNQNAIDFDDMIIRAIQVIENEDYIPKWRYILVDEFQDISGTYGVH
jgi:DNA helicase-4